MLRECHLSPRGRRSLIIFLTIASALLSTTSDASLQKALEQYFGPASANSTSRGALLSHIDALLSLQPGNGAGHTLKHVHDYSDARARKVAEVLPSLQPDNVDAWAAQVGDLVSLMDETHSFALTRRQVVAAILKLWLRKGQRLPPDSERKLEELLVKLYHKHRLGVAHKGVMEYLHVSKSGGTSWCHVAQLNGCVTEKFDNSYVCQIRKFDDKVRWLNMTFHMMQVPLYRVPPYVMNRFSRYGTYRKSQAVAACPSRHRYVHTRDYSYYSNEYTVHGGHEGPERAHMCKEFFNAVVLRDPLKRLVSHMKFVMWTMSGDRGYNDTQLFNMMYANRTSTFWQDLGPAIVDNYFVRSLLGEQAFHAPVGGVTPAMLALAQHVLAQFDLVMVLEQSAATRNLILHYGVGWRRTLEEVHDKDASQREREFNTSAYIPRDVERLLAAQGMDLQLYAYAMTLAHLDPVAYSVARDAGAEPLPPQLAAAAGREGGQCGLLRGNNNTALLKAMGARRPPGRLAGEMMRRGAGGAAGRARRAVAGARGAVRSLLGRLWGRQQQGV